MLLQQVWDRSSCLAINTRVKHAVSPNDGGWIWYVGGKARKEAKAGSSLQKWRSILCSHSDLSVEGKFFFWTICLLQNYDYK